MRISYTNLKAAHFRNIGKANQYNDTNLLADFNYNLGNRYQLIWGTLSSYINEDTLTASTVAAQQYYYYPPGTVGVDSMTITLGSVQYTLTPIYSQETWNMLNALTFQPSAIPQFFFPRRDDFGIWPIPQATYTISFNRFFRDRNLQVEDYVTGTVGISASGTTITGSGTTFTPAMVGRWFTVTDTTVPGQGYWYRISAYNSGTSLSTQTAWAGSTTSGAAYLIGETPELPEEAHILLPAGTAADFYAGLRNTIDKATWWNNVFWTGDGNNKERDIDSKNISAGLIGLVKKYKDRDRDILVMRQPSIISPNYKVWAQSINQ